MTKFRIFLIVFLLIFLAIGWYVSTGYYSKGERAGTISKLSEKGYVFKTNEGVLNEGGYSGETGTLTPRYWDFSAIEDSVVTQLRTAMQTGERVTLTYHEKFFQFPWNGDTKYFIIDVVFLPKPKQPVYENNFPKPPALPEATPDTINAAPAQKAAAKVPAELI